MGTEETQVDIVPETPDAEPAPPEPGIPGASPRRAPGQKEVIPFGWKVCGYAYDGLTLTFFKSIERADCEGQLERLQREGYYSGLAIYKVDEVPPPALLKKLPVKAKRPDTGPPKKARPVVEPSTKARRAPVYVAEKEKEKEKEKEAPKPAPKPAKETKAPPPPPKKAEKAAPPAAKKKAPVKAKPAKKKSKG